MRIKINKKPLIFWSKSIWFFDIDDTLIDTAGVSLQASEAIKEVLEKEVGLKTAIEIKKQFNNIFNLMLAGYRAISTADWQKVPGGRRAFDRLFSKIEALQKPIKKRYGKIKKWSREVFIKIAADRIGIDISPELIEKAASAYWLSLTEKTELFPYVLKLFEKIKEHKRPIYLLTSSDARLKMDENGQFQYFPSYSKKLKKKRILLLKKKGIYFDEVFIGDPEDKPSWEFFQKAIKMAERDLGKGFDFSQAIMVGDSFTGDLQIPKEKLKFGLVVLFKKELSGLKVIDRQQINTGNLLEILNFLKED